MHNQASVAPFTAATSTPKAGPFVARGGATHNQFVTYYGVFIPAGSVGFVVVLDADGNSIGGASSTATLGGSEVIPDGLWVKGPLTLTNASTLAGTIRWA